MSSITEKVKESLSKKKTEQLIDWHERVIEGMREGKETLVSAEGKISMAVVKRLIDKELNTRLNRRP